MKRSGPSARTKKLIFQEAGSQCVFCDETDVSALEIHHINRVEDGGTDGPENLILVCSSCHSKITQCVISPADVVTKKRELIYGKPKRTRASATNSIQVNGDVSQSILANVVKLHRRSAPKVNYTAGCVGANLQMRNYLDYLLTQYYEFRKADTSFGAHAHAKKFHHAEIHTSIRRRFKFRTFFVPQSKFEEECTYVKARIDNTILGRNNRSRGIQNYRSFEAFVKEQC